MTLVSISGPCSRAGKTALAVTVLRARPGARAAAVKFTTTDDVFEACPRGTPCVVCDIDVPFRIVEQADVLRQPGTDTDRLAEAAPCVVWAISKQAAVRAAWDAVRRRIEGRDFVVMEGSTIVETARPDLRLFVVHPFLSPERWKETSPGLLARADLVVVNRPAGETRAPSPEVMDAIAAHRDPADVLIADVTEPLASWAGPLAARLAAAVGAHA